jgi:hypothetical protein
VKIKNRTSGGTIFVHNAHFEKITRPYAEHIPIASHVVALLAFPANSRLEYIVYSTVANPWTKLNILPPSHIGPMLDKDDTISSLAALLLFIPPSSSSATKSLSNVSFLILY